MTFATQKIREDGLWCLDQGVRCFLAIGDKEALLIDSGFGGDVMAACKEITDKPVRLLLTHSDRDHAGCANQFEKVYMHAEEVEVFKEKNGYAAHGDMVLTPEMVPELYDLAKNICDGSWPEAEPAPERFPESVKIYSHGKAHFYLEKQ